MVYKLIIRSREYSSKNEQFSLLTSTPKVDQEAYMVEHSGKRKIWPIKLKLIRKSIHSGLYNC